MNNVVDLVGDFVSLIYPRYCLGCRGHLRKGEDSLCTRCLSELPKTNYHLCPDNPVRNRLAGRLPIRYGWAYLKFRKSGIVQRLLHELKYQNAPEIGIKLGLVFGHELELLTFSSCFDLIIPVPIHNERLKVRGYNQSAAFAEGLSQSMKVPWSESVTVRRTYASTQTKKSRADRWDNVKDAFVINESSLVYGRRVLLVDDVITTGATLEACGQHLVECGCRELSVACIAEAQ